MVKSTFNQTGQINLFDDGQISVVDITGKINQYLTQTLNTDAWNTIEIQYSNGSGKWFVSANGAPFESYFGKSSQGGTPNDNVNGFLLDTADVGYLWFDDVVLSNNTQNTLLFSDSFEIPMVGDPPGTNSPTVGTYSTIDPGTVDGGLLIVNGVNSTNYVDAPPNAPQLGITTPAQPRLWSSPALTIAEAVTGSYQRTGQDGLYHPDSVRN